jgi:hypothetical protein
MSKQTKNSGPGLMKGSDIFERVAQIIETSRAGVVRSVNHAMLTAYWLIGREIVEELQKGDERAEYGKQLIEDLSGQLTKRYGKGFSTPSLWNFRQFYQSYTDRSPDILSLSGRELNQFHILSPAGREFNGVTSEHPQDNSPKRGFASGLSWSRYRALMRVKNPEARRFYENEAVAKYSVLSDRKKIFAAKYMLYLPTEKELAEELKKERRLIEERLSLLEGEVLEGGRRE